MADCDWRGPRRIRAEGETHPLAAVPRLTGGGALAPHSAEPCDYPLIGEKVASAVALGTFDRGVLLCKSGIGIAIAANKIPGIRAAACGDLFDAKRSREHNDANVLVMGAEKVPAVKAARILAAWLSTPFESGGRHERRVRQITAIERRYLKRRMSRHETGDLRLQTSA